MSGRPHRNAITSATARHQITKSGTPELDDSGMSAEYHIERGADHADRRTSDRDREHTRIRIGRAVRSIRRRCSGDHTMRARGALLAGVLPYAKADRALRASREPVAHMGTEEWSQSSRLGDLFDAGAMMRTMVICPVCEQDVPMDKKRIVFHLARSIWTGQHYLCPGSQNATTPSTSGNRKVVSITSNVRKRRARLCEPCTHGQHLLCDGCDCSCADELDLPQSLTRVH